MARHRQSRAGNGSAHHINKIQEALEILNETARNKRQELYDVMGEQYEDIRSAFSDVKSTGRKTLHKARERASNLAGAQSEQIKQAAAQVDHKLRNNPWPILAGVAIGSFIVGY